MPMRRMCYRLTDERPLQPNDSTLFLLVNDYVSLMLITHNVLEVLVEVNSGQVGRSSSLWLLIYRRIADLGIPNFSSNGAAGQIPLALRFQNNFSKTPRMGHNFIGDPLEVTISEAMFHNRPKFFFSIN